MTGLQDHWYDAIWDYNARLEHQILQWMKARGDVDVQEYLRLCAWTEILEHDYFTQDIIADDDEPEARPAQYKAGDKVRLVGITIGEGIHPGTVGIVERCPYLVPSILVNFDGVTAAVSPKHLEALDGR